VTDQPKKRGGAFLPILVAIIVVGAIAASPLYLPSTRSEQDKLDAELSPAVQKISSQISAVNAGLAAVADLRKQLVAADIKLSADAAAAAAKNKTAAAELEKHLEETAKILTAVQRKYPNIGEGQPLSAKLGSVESAARSSYQQFEKLLADNEKALASAERDINTIRNKTVGEAKAKDSVALNQLAALIAYQQGLIAANRADLLRRLAAEDRAAAFSMLRMASDARSAMSGIDAQTPTQMIEQTEKLIDLTKRQLDTATAVLARLDKEIATRTAEVDSQRRTAEDARQSLSQLERSPSYASSDYRRQYQQLADTARVAEARAERLEFGTLAGAKVEEPPGGDLLSAVYSGGKVEPGLNTLRARREGLKSDTDAMAKSLDALNKQLEASNTVKADLEKQRDEIKNLEEQATAANDDLAKRAAALSTAARADEGKAVKSWESAARSAADAVRASQQRSRLAREASSKAPPDKPNLRLKEIADDKDSEASSRFLAGQIYSAQAELELNRMLDSQSATALAAARAKVTGETPPAASAEIGEARKRGVELAAKAIDELAKAGKDIGAASHTIGGTRIQGSFYKWQFLSAEAAAHLLMSQLTDSPNDREEQREKANQLLTESAKGREGSPLLASTIETIIYLQRTSGGGGSGSDDSDDSAE